MPVTILAPMSGDTVLNPVTVSSGYFGLSADTILCQIATRDDGPSDPLDDDGVHPSVPALANVPTGPQTVNVFLNNNADPEDSQESVIVTNDPNQNPVPIEGLDGPEPVVKENKKKFTVNGGEVPDGSAAAYVVCQAIEVDVAIRKYTVVAVGVTLLDEEKKWQVDLKFEVKDKETDTNVQYVVRAFAYDKTQRLLGSQTLPVAKKKEAARKKAARKKAARKR